MGTTAHSGLGIVAALLLTNASAGQMPAPAAPSQAAASQQVPVEVYEPPHLKHLPDANCGHSGLRASVDACLPLQEGFEGWVRLYFMVDPSGKPFEVTVTQSSGRKEFDALAVQALENATFEPALLNGKPIESGMGVKYKFIENREQPGARSAFVADYKAVAQAAETGDRTAADAGMSRLAHEITNLYEDAYYGMATYLYAKNWGDEQTQLAALSRAIAEEDQAKYLPPKLFRVALQISMQLQASLREYAEALDTYQKMREAGVAADVLTALKPTLDQLEKLRTDRTAYAIDGRMPSDGNWYLHLFKRHFQVEVAEGYVAQVKLRCQKKYLTFVLDPKLAYAINDKEGDCWMELDGSPGAGFKLVQF